MDPQNAEILIVDDDTDYRLLIQTHLEQLGYKNIESVENSKSALDKLDEKNVDLIISDLYMPGIDGVDFFNMVQSSDQLKHIPFIMITSANSKGQTAKMRNSAISQFLRKPFKQKDLQEKIERLLRS